MDDSQIQKCMRFMQMQPLRVLLTTDPHILLNSALEILSESPEQQQKDAAMGLLGHFSSENLILRTILRVHQPHVIRGKTSTLPEWDID